jgi:hypothetical protein
VSGEGGGDHCAWLLAQDLSTTEGYVEDDEVVTAAMIRESARENYPDLDS